MQKEYPCRCSGGRHKFSTSEKCQLTSTWCRREAVLASWQIHQLLADLPVEFTGLAVTTFAIAAFKFMAFPATPSKLQEA